MAIKKQVSMKECPKCQKEFQDYENFCPYCGMKLVDKVSSELPSFSVSGNANAVSAHIDSHNVQTIIEAQKSDAERYDLNKRAFQKSVEEKYRQSNLDQKDLAALKLLASELNLTPQDSEQIIELVRKNMEIIHGSKGKDQAISLHIEEIQSLIQQNESSQLEQKLGTIEKYALCSANENIQYYYYMLLASFSPKKLTADFLLSNQNNYWQLYWSYASFLKTGDNSSIAELQPRISSFSYPFGNYILLEVIYNLFVYNKNQLDYYLIQGQQKIAQVEQYKISEQLYPFFETVKSLFAHQDNLVGEQAFYCQNTLKGIVTPKKATTHPSFAQTQVDLTQMQGFNPVVAAQSFHLGEMPDMLKTLNTLKTIGRIAEVPQIGEFNHKTPPPIPSNPTSNFQRPCPTQNAPAGNKFSAEAIQMAESVRESYDELDNDDPLLEKEGIILTNSERLSEKYHCPQQEIIDLLQVFIQSAGEQKMTWHLLDVVCYTELLGDNPRWNHYNDLITLFINQKNLNKGMGLSLFIVGGDDVIPVPVITDPYENGNGSVPCDMCYSFEGTYLSCLIDGELGELSKADVRNCVSRLPLEDGELKTDLQGDLGSYLNLCSIYPKGIPVGSVVMNSHSDWVPASTTMSEHLPLLYEVEDPELVRNGMYVSPKLLTTDQKSVDIYSKSLKKADMLMFNLHGSDDPSYAGFYSVDEAFNADLLNRSSARVFNTVACFGARYIDYNRDESILLSALYGGGILLYTGSLVSVPMYYDYSDPQSNEVRALLLNPGTGSEIFMRLYSLYLFKGIPAGQALLQAKLDYYNMCRYVENPGFTLSTIMMFSLYGNPMLHVKRQVYVIDSALENDAMPPAPVKSTPSRFKKTKLRRIFSKSKSGNLLEQVQDAVASNFEYIRRTIESTLNSTLNLTPQMIESISEFESYTYNGQSSNGYFFNYHIPNARFSSNYYVEVDANGIIKRIYTTK